LGLGFRAAERRAETLPVGETGGATGVGGFAGNRLHGTRSVEEAGRKPLRRAPGAEPPSNRAASAAPTKTHPCGDRPARRRARGPGGHPPPRPPGRARVQRGKREHAHPDRLRQKLAVCAPLIPCAIRGVAGAGPPQNGYGQTLAGRQGKAFP